MQEDQPSRRGLMRAFLGTAFALLGCNQPASVKPEASNNSVVPDRLAFSYDVGPATSVDWTVYDANGNVVRSSWAQPDSKS
jgi:hypothetical protein